jgi:hypothetical protein
MTESNERAWQGLWLLHSRDTTGEEQRESRSDPCAFTSQRKARKRLPTVSRHLVTVAGSGVAFALAVVNPEGVNPTIAGQEISAEHRDNTRSQ